MGGRRQKRAALGCSHITHLLDWGCRRGIRSKDGAAGVSRKRRSAYSGGRWIDDVWVGVRGVGYVGRIGELRWHSR